MLALSLPVIGLALLAILVLYRLDILPWRRRNSRNRSSWSASVRANPYPAVSIRNASPCEAVARIKGQRFLGREAPSLPLPGCTASHCQCRYVHHVDRRTGTLDRRRLIGEHRDFVNFFGKEDQREGRGRRASDWAQAYNLNPPVS